MEDESEDPSSNPPISVAVQTPPPTPASQSVDSAKILDMYQKLKSLKTFDDTTILNMISQAFKVPLDQLAFILASGTIPAPIQSVGPQVPAPSPLEPKIEPSTKFDPGLAKLTAKGKTLPELQSMYDEIKGQHPNISHQGILTILQSRLSSAVRGTPVELEARVVTMDGPRTFERKTTRKGQSPEASVSSIDWLIYYNEQYHGATMTLWDQDSELINKVGEDGKRILMWGNAYRMNVSLELRKLKDENTGEEFEQYLLYANRNTQFAKIADWKTATSKLPTVPDFFKSSGHIRSLSEMPTLNNQTVAFVGYIGEIRERQDGKLYFMFNDQTQEDPTAVFVNEPMLSALSDAISKGKSFEGTKALIVARVWIRPDGTGSLTCRGLYPMAEE
jgi:hypothetical protein